MSGYIGSQPADSFLSITSQQITGNGGATYTLNSSVTSPEDLAVFVNNIRQNPNNYSVSNNQITLGGTIASSDSCYVVFLGKTLATVSPPSSSVGLTQLSATGTKNNTTFLRGDNTFATPSGGSNTPNFLVRRSSDQSFSDATGTKVQFNSEVYDSASAFDSSSNYRFTVPSGQAGKYFFYGTLVISSEGDSTNVNSQVYVYKNGSIIAQYENNNSDNNPRSQVIPYTYSESLSVADYIEIYAYCNTSNNASPEVIGHSTRHSSTFGGYKIIE